MPRGNGLKVKRKTEREREILGGGVCVGGEQAVLSNPD